MARKKLETLTEQMFYVLLSLKRERHGYGIMQAITEMTGGRVSVGAGTLYALLERFEGEGFITFTRMEDKRKYYKLPIFLRASSGRVIQLSFSEWRSQTNSARNVALARFSGYFQNSV